MQHNFSAIAKTTTRFCVLLCWTTLLVGSITAHAFPVKFGIGPDNNQSVLTSTIRSAKESLLINIYQFDNSEVAQAVIDRIEAGVAVSILLEGQPLGQLSADGKKVLSALQSAMADAHSRQNHLYIMSSATSTGQLASKSTRRYRYDHAKYIVIDESRVLVSSENFTGTGHAKAGTVGNRGWEAVVDNTELAHDLINIFNTDIDESFGDVRELPARLGTTDLPVGKKNEGRKVPAIAAGRGEASDLKLIDSPNSLDGLTTLIQSARNTLDLEFMSLPSNWRTPVKGQSPLVTELIRAAQRGVRVRVLLNDDTVFDKSASASDPSDDETDPPEPLKPNQVTVNLLQSIGSSEHVSLSARIVDIKAVGITYIHNKGITVDGTKVLVSSINGTSNSIMNNREVGIILTSPDAAQYFGNAFAFDWAQSADLRAKAPTHAPSMNSFFTFYEMLN